MSSFNIPPLGNLPHWSRVGSLDKAHFPRLLLRDRLQNLPTPLCVDSRGDMDTRVASLERDIHFLQLHHKDTLERLHGELDNLKRENKELQYKLIMDPAHVYRQGSSRRSPQTQTQPHPEPQPPTEVSPEWTLHTPTSPQPAAQSKGTEPCGSLPKAADVTSSPWPDPDPETVTEARGRLITSLQPLRIHCSPSRPPRAPTLQECEVIIRQLYNANSLQSQEILRMKAVLKDIVLKKRMSPETCIVTKAYLAHGCSRTEEAERFPKLPVKPPPKRLEGSRVGVAERVVLPALKLSLGSSVAERQRRAQALQRGRLRRTVH